MKNIESTTNAKTRIVILGGGFAGVKCAKRLESKLKKYNLQDQTEIILVNEKNYILFTPLLPQVISGTVQARNSVIALRPLFDNTTIYENKIAAFDASNKTVTLEKESSGTHFYLDYDMLILATGSTTNFFGMQDIQQKAYTLKTLDDAVSIREHAINMLERAEKEQNNKEKQKLLTFVIVGGGFAGVETAGELSDFIYDSAKHYHSIPKNMVRIVILEALQRILPEFDQGLAEFAHQKLQSRGILLHTNAMVKGLSDQVEYEQSFEDHNDKHNKDNKDIEKIRYSISASTLIWTAGVQTSKIITDSKLETDRFGVKVNKYLQCKGADRVFAVGDCASIIDPSTGKPLPPTAQHAESQAVVVADNICELIRTDFGARLHPKLKEVAFESRGQMAVIGKRTAIASVYGFRLSGFLAWVIWRMVYLSKIPRWHKRVRIGFDWFSDSVFEREITRLKMAKRNKTDLTLP